ncbi:MAG: hypothetical protein M0Z30_11870 [Actinomycetota bacterium]|nr:hypothetical protein [Actinomycetota bacterium]
MAETCAHLGTVGDVAPSSGGCEEWWWCYPDQFVFEVDGAPPSPSHS